MRLPKISIVIPSYNKVDYIEETLRSIVDQEYPNLEVIIQDGGSTDGTLDIIKSYVKKHPSLFSLVLEKDNGQTDAINKGLRKAKGEVVTYINADDTYERGALRKVGGCFAKNPRTLWLAGEGRVIDANGREIARLITAYKNLLLAINHYSLLLMVNYLMQPSVFLKKDTFESFGPFFGNKSFIMEYDLWLKLGRNEMPKVLSSYLSNFRIEAASKTSREYKNILFEDMKIVKKYTKNSFLVFLHWLNNLARLIFISKAWKTK